MDVASRARLAGRRPPMAVIGGAARLGVPNAGIVRGRGGDRADGKPPDDAGRQFPQSAGSLPAIAAS